jgi:hypothetical protein
VNTTSTAQGVIITNTASTSLTITGVSASAGYTETDNCGTLASNGTCTVNVSFVPSASGPGSGTVTVSYGGTTSSITTSGTGVNLGLAPLPASFGNQLINTSSTPQSVTITNTGDAAITITSIVTSAGFTQGNNCGTLASNATCSVNIAFAPTAAGAQNGTVTINYGGTHSTINVSGTGTDFSVAPQSGSPSSITIPAGQTASFNLSVAGTIGFTGTLNLSCTGAPAQSNCSLSSSSATVNGTTPVNFTANISTTKSSSSLPSFRFPQLPPALLLLVVAAILITLLIVLTPRRTRVRYIGAIVVSGLLLAAMTGCGGGGGGSGGGTVHVIGTPAGTYTVVVTATSGNISRNFNLTLTVQ